VLSLCFTDLDYPEGLWLQIPATIVGGVGTLYALWRPLASTRPQETPSA
jgi:hypothetical protein